MATGVMDGGMVMVKQVLATETLMKENISLINDMGEVSTSGKMGVFLMESFMKIKGMAKVGCCTVLSRGMSGWLTSTVVRMVLTLASLHQVPLSGPTVPSTKVIL